MLALTQNQILLIVALVAVYVFFAYRVSRQMARNGHNQWLWFVVSVLLTSLPAAIVMTHERFSWLWKRTQEEQARRARRGGGDEDDADDEGADQEQAEETETDATTGPAATPGDQTAAQDEVPPLVRCPHCGSMVAPAGPADPTGLIPCPRCGQSFEQEHLA